MRSDVAAVILAGGEGSRIGGNKPLLKLAGERLIDRAVRLARGWSEVIAVAVRDPAQVGHVDAPTIADDSTIEGPMGGLASALHFAADAGCTFGLTIPADMPFLPADLLDRLAAEIGGSACALASSGGHFHPVCGLWRTGALERLGDYLVGERRSLRGFADMVGYRAVEWAGEPLDPFFNINTADDLAAAERIISG